MKSVIIPTLNEEDTIGQLIGAIFRYLGDTDTSVIVVDDNSQDRTQDVVLELAKKWSSLKLVVRESERGLRSAVQSGTRHVQGPVVVMDADLSHNPRHLPRMFELLKEGHDVVIGSRYAPGASIAGWPMKRLIISKIVTLLLRVMLRVPVTDPLSGFVGVRTPEILTNDIKYANYKFLLELIVATKSLRIKETPILFTDRHKGESKLSLRVARNFLELVLRLLVRNLIGFARSH